MDDDENQDQLINRNTSQGKNRRQVPFLESENEDDSDESGSDEEDDLGEDDDDEDGSTDDEEGDEDEGPLAMGNSNPSQSTGDLNEDHSSDEEKEQCPICLNVFRDQIVGTPENCNHYFCLDCIVEWGKNANSCPVDRISFSSINVRAHFGGEILRNVPVINTATQREDDDDVTYCEVCGRSDREDRLLLCDGCDAGYHMECLTPALHSVPVDEWFCPECVQTNIPQEDTERVSEEEVAGILADVIPTTSRLRPTSGRTRAIARTRQSERVRANVNRNRISTARNIQEVPIYLTTSLLDETIEAVVAGLNTAVYQRPLGPRSSSTRSKKKAGKKRTKKSKMPKGARGVRKKRRRRFKRWKIRQTVKKTETSHSRIAKSLGLCNPTRGSSLPCVQRSVEPTLGSMRQDIGAASLSVFGNPHDLDPFDSNDDHSSSPTSSLTARRRVLSRSALRSHQPVARPIPVGLSRRDVASLAQEPEVIAEPVPDLLGSILSGQSMLMMKSSDILISRDGSLMAKKQGVVEATQNSSLRHETKAVHRESVSSHSGSSSSSETWKPFEQYTQPMFPSSGLYSLSPSPSPPPSSACSRSLERVSLPSSSMPGTSAFRLKNAFTPRAVQVQSSATRLASKLVEPPRFNGTLHKPEPLSSSIHTPQQDMDIKHLLNLPAKRLEISELPRIPKIKKDMDHNPINEAGKHLVPLAGTSTNILPTSCVNQLTGRGGNHQLGSINTTGSKMKSSHQETHSQSRHNAGVSSSHASSSSTAQHSSGGVRSMGSLDGGGGGLRITISGNSGSSCRQFSPSSCDPFRASESKTPQKNTPPHSSSGAKRAKPLKNEIYDPFEPTGSDSGSRGSSPERPGPSSVLTSVSSSTVASTGGTSQSSGAKVGTFRSFRFLTTHTSKISVSKLGPDFSDMSPSSKQHRVPEKAENQSPVLPSFTKVDREIKQEIIEVEKDEKTPFRISCPLSGLKIDLKSGGVRGFHFDSEKEKHFSIKPEPEALPTRVIHQGTTSNRVVWEMESPSSLSSSTTHGLEQLKVKTKVKEEPVVRSRSRSQTCSQDRESRSASWSSEAEREKKLRSKSHKVKQARSDRSSSGSCDRSRKKRQKEKKKEKKKKNLDSKERKRSRSRSPSSSSHKKKKKKKRQSRSSSPEKDKKRKHKHEKNYPNKDGSFRVKEKKKSKEERGRPQSKSPQLAKEHMAHQQKEKSTDFRDKEINEELLHSPDRSQKAVTCTVNVKTEFYSVKEETRNPQTVSPKLVVERNSFSSVEKNISVFKEEQDIELSNDDDVVKMEANSPPWSPSLLDSILPENKTDSSQGSPTQGDITHLSELPLKAEAISPQASLSSSNSEPPSPKPHSPHFSPHTELVQPVSRPPVKTEAEDLQWSPSHLDDFLFNELSDDVCSAGAVSPDDVDLEEAILMRREGDFKEAPLVSFSKKQAIPFLQDDGNSGDEGTGNHVDEAVTTISVAKAEGTIATSSSKPEATEALLSKAKPQMKRVTWNLHSKGAEHSTETTADVPPCKRKKEETQPASPKQTANLLSDVAVNSPTSVFSLAQESSQTTWTAMTRPMKEASRLPWMATETPLQVFPQTLPPLPLPPVFPPYAPVSEPTVPGIVQSSGAMITQTPKPGSLATANEPKMQAASTGEGKGKAKTSLKGEKVKNEEYMKKLHMQERAVEEVKLAIKPFYQKREITKDEYKDILRKAVQKICHSKSGEINPVKVVNLVKAYVDKYKHLRKHRKLGTKEDPFIVHGSPV